MMITEYIESLNRDFRTGRAVEHTYRPALKQYLETLLPNIRATNEAKRQKCGAPDYIVSRHTRGNDLDIGYIEAKDIGKNLNEIEKDSQLKRYKESLDNLILTDYMDFRFFRNGEKVAEVKIAEVDDFFRTDGATIKPLPENFEKLETLLKDFADFKGQTIKSAKSLAIMMARKAKLMQEVFCKAVIQEEEHTGLKGQLDAFRRILIHDMEAKEFADVYAQTITYGLFTARLHDETLDDFSRAEALNLIPLSNPFLRKLFQYVALELDDSVAWIVDALCEVFRATNVRDILADFGKQTGRNDPIVHFYETFLAEYNPALRKSRGVWYTPEAVVNFIIRAVDDCLKTYFNLPSGLADTSKVKIKVEGQAFDKRTKSGKVAVEKEVHKVQLLDVATGTGTFIAEVIKQIYNGHFQSQQGSWSGYVDEHLLPRLHGFEILMASYAMCHMKIDLLLRETGYKPKDTKKPQRLGVYLTNSLEEAHPDAETLFASWLSAEANEANVVKRETPVMVAFGNPPYSVSSQNKGAWITKLIADYKKDLNEKNINSLSDDYIKFIRYAEHFVEKTGYGIVAMITNNSFLDGIIHRQMRKHLLETFDAIYIYDLHGSAKKKETAPDGSPDNNVFDIMQGVSISLFIKHKQKKSGLAEVYHAELFGKRESKYERLWEGGIKESGFKKLEYNAPYYFFIPKDFEEAKKYEKGFKVSDLFGIGASGIKTERDDLVIQFDEAPLLQIESDLKLLEPEIFRKKYTDKKDGRDWQVATAKQDIMGNQATIVEVAYRPFDIRKTLYTGKTKGVHAYPRFEVMQHFLFGENLALLFKRSRLLGGTNDYRHVSVCNSIVDLNYLADQTFCFPLYLYPTEGKQLALGEQQVRRPNLDMEIVGQISKGLGLPFVPDHEDKKADGKNAFSPLDLLDYIYAVLHSPTYRETYKEFLKIDFPRVPYPKDAKTFWQLVALGKELRQLHLLEGITNQKFITKYPASGDNKVEKIAYENGNVYINQEQYFEGVPETAWNFYIGGYQPAQKWLKDRKGRELTFDDINHYQKIIVALTETHHLMQEIDKVWKP